MQHLLHRRCRVGFVLYLVLLFRECFTLIGSGRMIVNKEKLYLKTAVYSIDGHASLSGRHVLGEAQQATPGIASDWLAQEGQ